MILVQIYCFKAILSILFVTIVCIFILFITQYVPGNDKGNDAASLLILIWYWPFHKTLNLTSNVCYDLYGIKNCQLTDNRSMLVQADVVVFHHKELQKSSDVPYEMRPPGQKWVWASLESPSNVMDLEKWNHTFNWVLSYRQDSDIFVPYGKLVLHSPSNSFTIPPKTGLVSWVISNYKSIHERALLYKKLFQHVTVDIYGKAAKKELCPKCLLPVVSKYKFYLAFENSIHRDYITEKMWYNSFEACAVPVVLGPPRTNYEQFVPPDSFIHVEDFESPEKLAIFLRTMNTSQYKEFFKWRRKYSLKLFQDWRERFCSICTVYHSLPQEKIYHNLQEWFKA